MILNPVSTGHSMVSETRFSFLSLFSSQSSSFNSLGLTGQLGKRVREEKGR
jgi:hypothetical protein